MSSTRPPSFTVPVLFGIWVIAVLGPSVAIPPSCTCSLQTRKPRSVSFWEGGLRGNAKTYPNALRSILRQQVLCWWSPDLGNSKCSRAKSVLPEGKASLLRSKAGATEAGTPQPQVAVSTVRELSWGLWPKTCPWKVTINKQKGIRLSLLLLAIAALQIPFRKPCTEWGKNPLRKVISKHLFQLLLLKTNHCNARWPKIILLLCSWILWVRHQDMHKGIDSCLLHLVRASAGRHEFGQRTFTLTHHLVIDAG